jgi:tRNA U34 5-methylaminomethyl-2-thiouridine-forming methyltransferase MnmC
MPVPDRPTFASSDPRWQVRITDDNSPTLVQTSSGDSMHSGCGAVAETRHVYLNGSGVAQRLADQAATRVLELGFGTGMGWLLTADAAIASAAPLFYLGLENQLPPAAVIEQLDLGRFVQCHGLLEAYCDWLDSLPQRDELHDHEPATVEFRFKSAGLQLHLGDAVAWCQGPAWNPYRSPNEEFDAVYFDPFSPEAAPRLWQQDIFAVMAQLLKVGGSLVSYCVSRAVRDSISAAGLIVTRTPGPTGGKREVLRALKPLPILADDQGD